MTNEGIGISLRNTVIVHGGVQSVLLLWILRMLFPPPGGSPRAAIVSVSRTMSLDELRKKAEEFQVTISRRNLREYIAALFVFASATLNFSKMRIGSALIIAGVSYVVYHLHSRGSARIVPKNAAWGHI